MKTIAVVMASYNRRETTLRSLESLFAQELPPATSLAVYLTDDNSPDGTAAAVQARFPQVNVIAGTGNLYWTGGTARSWSRAIPSDFYLLFNDDVVLKPKALLALWRTYQEAGDSRAIAAGCVKNVERDVMEYGGKRIGSRLAFRFDTVTPTEKAERCTTFNGNFVLIPEAARLAIGMVDTRYPHGFADYDYGLRASKVGIPVWVSPGHHGDCPSSSFAGSYRDPSLSRGERWKAILHAKGLPPAAYWRFIKTHAPWPKFIYWIAPYVKVLLGSPGRTS